MNELDGCWVLWTWYLLWEALSLRCKDDKVVRVLHPVPARSMGVCGAMCGKRKGAWIDDGKSARRGDMRVIAVVKPWRQERRASPFHQASIN